MNKKTARLFKFANIGLMTTLLLTINTPIVWSGPTSDVYELKDYSFGSGGSDSDSENYSILGITGEPTVNTDPNNPQLSSSNYKIGTELNYTMMANVPPAPTFTNPSNYYNKLKLVLNNGDNASDAKFAIAISSDNFATDTKYVQSDNSPGSTLGLEDWQTYSSWGGASGFLITGLQASTTYTVKVAAKRGEYTESGFGPTAQASTADNTLTFDIDVSETDTETSTPFEISLGELTLSTVSTSTKKVWVDLETNANSGANVYITSLNGGLKSTVLNFTITSSTADLSSANLGYGVRGVSSSLTQSAGGPMQLGSTYNLAGNNVGIVNNTQREVFNSNNSPITAGRGHFELKAKIDGTVPAEDDYADTITLVAAAAF